MAQNIKPVALGGYGRQAGKDGGLTNFEFSSRCPPDINPQTRIIAVCGVNNYMDASSPQEDGWFHSDFYLFHHLFSGTGSSQTWLTCVHPKDLVSTYTEYVHGNRLEMRRIVLDATMLPSVIAAGDIHVVSPNDLLADFTKTVQTECQIAAQNDQPVLILIFGHGDEATYGVAIGGETTPDKSPRLTIDKMREAMGKLADVTLMMTSCFSGGWVVKTNRMTSKPALNATMLTAAGPKVESESWTISDSSGRAAGSIFVSALLQAAIKQQAQDEGCEDEEDIRASTAYVGWAKVIYDTGRSEVDRFFHKHDVKFASKNDAWGLEWKARSGFPMTDYKGKWEMLRTIPIDISNPLSNRAPDAMVLSPRSSANLSLGQPGSTRVREGFQGSFSNIVREQAWQYLSSYPGNSASGGNTPYHKKFKDLVDGKDFEMEGLQVLSNVLSYRAAMMGWATSCKDYLNLPINDAHLFNTWEWELQLLSDEQEGQKKWNLYQKVRSAVSESRIIDSPAPGQGLFYTKPVDYLAIAFYESKRPRAQVMTEIEKLLNMKAVRVALLSEEVWRDPVVQRESNKFWRTFNKIGKRLRSLSPSKEKRKSRG